MPVQIDNVSVTTASGSQQQLGEWNGKVLLIVNVASRCGFTRQYAGLQALQAAYGSQGFSVLAFPCNDFGAQEPGSVEEIQQFCSTTYGVDFPIYGKVAISAAPFDTLVQAEPAGPVAWNFEKFLVGKDGTVIARYKSGVEPDSAELKGAIEAALAA
ncbi:glutathione peroxidase [Synechococcus sp. CB0101]|uniref:glutathione peroxidase n=1 Tax=Synechococcus sp. CB0101 TaxID=232348 RepID=UPI00020019D1|nr:glutathione peroxidase [Synechococcus sp. CB0101]QCH15054.1 glutathione peroxidase [Synechococcus sp. CB0101]